jgi:hypothetical protein
MKFKPGQLLTWIAKPVPNPEYLGLYLVLKSETEDSLWLMTLESADADDVVGEVCNDYAGDYLPIEQVQ